MGVDHVLAEPPVTCRHAAWHVGRSGAGPVHRVSKAQCVDVDVVDVVSLPKLRLELRVGSCLVPQPDVGQRFPIFVDHLLYPRSRHRRLRDIVIHHAYLVQLMHVAVDRYLLRNVRPPPLYLFGVCDTVVYHHYRAGHNHYHGNGQEPGVNVPLCWVDYHPCTPPVKHAKHDKGGAQRQRGRDSIARVVVDVVVEEHGKA